MNKQEQIELYLKKPFEIGETATDKDVLKIKDLSGEELKVYQIIIGTGGNGISLNELKFTFLLLSCNSFSIIFFVVGSSGCFGILS